MSSANASPLVPIGTLAQDGVNLALDVIKDGSFGLHEAQDTVKIAEDVADSSLLKQVIVCVKATYQACKCKCCLANDAPVSPPADPKEKKA
jgi:hypothetical protein